MRYLLRRALVKARYVLELGGKNGYEINGAPGYWGRYGTLDKIVEIAKNLDDDDYSDWGDYSLSFSIPFREGQSIDYHRVTVSRVEGEYTTRRINFLVSPDCSGVYEKNVEMSMLLTELTKLISCNCNLEQNGYHYVPDP